MNKGINEKKCFLEYKQTDVWFISQVNEKLKAQYRTAWLGNVRVVASTLVFSPEGRHAGRKLAWQVHQAVGAATFCLSPHFYSCCCSALRPDHRGQDHVRARWPGPGPAQEGWAASASPGIMLLSQSAWVSGASESISNVPDPLLSVLVHSQAIA